MTHATLIPRDLAYQKFHDAFQLFVGAGRRWSCAAVAEASGIPLRTVESYRSGQATPTIEKYQSLCCVLGTPFFSATIEHLPFRVDSTDPEGTSPQRLLIDALDFSTALAKFLEDNKIDHRERPLLKARVRALAEQLSQLENHLIAEERG